MKSPWTALVLLAALAAAGHAAPKSAARTGRAIATAYFEALIGGDAEKATALAAAPFSLDRKEILQTQEAVAAKHQQIVGDKGQRKIPPYEVTVPDKPVALDRAVFPASDVFRFTLKGDDEHVDIYVTKGASPKVIGFSD